MRRQVTVDTLGACIRQARAQRRITLRGLAADLGITPSYLSDIENDRRVPAYRVLEGIARRLQVELDELLARAGRLDPEAQEYLKRSPGAVRLFRKIATHGLSEEDLARLERLAGRLARRGGGR